MNIEHNKAEHERAKLKDKLGEMLCLHTAGYRKSLNLVSVKLPVETIEHVLDSLADFMAKEVSQTEKAYGGCHNCYGKGYATAPDLWAGYDTDTDIGSPGGPISGGEPVTMKYCTCERGKQLDQMVAKEVAAARLDERKQIALDNYHGHTFSDSTNWKGKFEKFIDNNERRIAQLTLRDGEEGGRDASAA